MSDKTKILVVDDDSFMHEMFAEALSGNYDIIAAESAADALMLVQNERPSLILMDVEMPGMDGYEACRRFKEMDATSGVPVIFVSAHDQIEERLKGYEAGGEDYVVKPFIPQELEAKVVQLLKATAERASLKDMANYATTTAMTAMTSMSEMGALLESLKHFNSCYDHKSLADAMLAGLSSYGLQGAARILFKGGALTRTNQGDATPLEISVISHMAGMDRITQFKTRMSITYAHAALLVNDMPVEDPERCGRLRDYLAMLVEGAEVRTQGIMVSLESQQRGEAIEQAVVRVTAALNEIDATQRHNRAEMRMAFSALTDEVEKALLRVAMTHEQEEFLSGIISSGIESILDVQSAETDLQNKLSTIIKELKEMLKAA